MVILFFSVLLDFTGFYWVLQDLLGLTDLYLVFGILIVFTEFFT